MDRRKLVYSAVFLMQFGGSVGMTGLPIAAKFLFDSSLWGLAAIGVSGPLLYTLTCLLVSAAKGRVRPVLLMTTGTCVMAATFALAVFSTRTWHLVAVCGLQGIGAALFWPMIEAAVAQGSSGRRAARRMARFNIGWSTGDALGTAAAGGLFALRPTLPFEVTILVMAAVLACVLLARSISFDTPQQERDDPPAPPSVNAGFRKAAWIGNFVASGVTNVLRSVFAAPAKDIFLMSAPVIGLVIGTFNATRTLTFFALGRWRNWHYRGSAFLAVNSLLALGMLGVVAASYLSPSLASALVFASFAAAGIGSGMTYFSSIFYTIDRAEAVEATAPIHEAVLGAGAPATAAAAGFTGQLASSPLSPLVMCAAVVVAGMAVSAGFIRAARPSA